MRSNVKHVYLVFSSVGNAEESFMGSFSTIENAIKGVNKILEERKNDDGIIIDHIFSESDLLMYDKRGSLGLDMVQEFVHITYKGSMYSEVLGIMLSPIDEYI